VIWNRLVVGAIAVLALVVIWDGTRGHGTTQRQPIEGYRIDLASSRDGTWHPVSKLREAFPGASPTSLAISKVAVASDEVAAIGVSHVPGDRPASAAVELWHGDRLLSAFPVPVASFTRGLWFAGDGRAIATIGADGTGYLYDRHGHRLSGTAYFAYETR
jgi:hypothetical protein